MDIDARQHPLARRALLRGLAFLAFPALGAATDQTAAIAPSRRGSTIADDAPAPVSLPQDDSPHDAVIEWWYFTGHLFTGSGDRYGFQFVVFKADTGAFLGYASHFAVTDNAMGSFQYDQRLSLEPQPAPQTGTSGFDLEVGGWTMSGSDGGDRLNASMDGYAIDLLLESAKPPVLHNGNGFFDYGGGQGSYYYSRTRIDVTGEIIAGDDAVPVAGHAWFDHQWGDFTLYEDGGWDWYAVQLNDHSEIMLYLINNPDGSPRLGNGSLIAPDGALKMLEQLDFIIEPTGTWISDTTGITYPSGWNIEIPSAQILLELAPSMADQELDTTATTRVIYWEGEVVVAGTKAGEPITGLGYVELTGYDDR